MTAIVDTAPAVTNNKEVGKYFFGATSCRDIPPLLLDKPYHESWIKGLEATKMDEHKIDPPVQPDIHSQKNLNREWTNEKGLLAIKDDEHTGDDPQCHQVFYSHSQQ